MTCDHYADKEQAQTDQVTLVEPLLEDEVNATAVRNGVKENQLIAKELIKTAIATVYIMLILKA